MPTFDRLPLLCGCGEAAAGLRPPRAEDVGRLFRKWLDRLPLPLSPRDRKAGYDWQDDYGATLVMTP